MADIVDNKVEIKENIKSKVALLDKKPRIDFIYFENDKSTEIYFNRAKKSAESAGMIGALHNLNSNTSEKDFLTLKWELPCIEEQNKIANFLSSIDTKIQQTQKQLESSKEFRKALFQQMFV